MKGFAMIVYFTGTGNSRYAAQFLAHALGDRVEVVIHTGISAIRTKF